MYVCLSVCLSVCMYVCLYASSIRPTEITDLFQLQMMIKAEEEYITTSSWPSVLLAPQTVNEQIQFSFLQEVKGYFSDIYGDKFLLVEPRFDIFAIEAYFLHSLTELTGEVTFWLTVQTTTAMASKQLHRISPKSTFSSKQKSTFLSMR